MQYKDALSLHPVVSHTPGRDPPRSVRSPRELLVLPHSVGATPSPWSQNSSWTALAGVGAGACVSDWGIGGLPIPTCLWAPLCVCGDDLLSCNCYEEELEEGVDGVTLHGGST